MVEAAGAEIRGGKSQEWRKGRGLAAGGQVRASLRLIGASPHLVGVSPHLIRASPCLVGASLHHTPTEGLGGRCQNWGGDVGRGEPPCTPSAKQVFREEQIE